MGCKTSIIGINALKGSILEKSWARAFPLLIIDCAHIYKFPVMEVVPYRARLFSFSSILSWFYQYVVEHYFVVASTDGNVPRIE